MSSAAPGRASRVHWLLDVPGADAALAGVVGGLAMGAYEMIAVGLAGGRWLAPLELIASAHPLAPRHPALVGFGMHVVTAGFWGTRFGAIASVAPAKLLRSPWILGSGLAWGVGVWVVMGKIVGPILNPMIMKAPEPHFFVGHLVYGIVTALTFGRLARPRV